MPHGMGSHHHFVGGGGSHGRHHHHHLHTQIAHVGFYNGPYYGSYRRRPLSWGLGSILFAIVLVVAIVLSLRYTVSGDTKDSGLEYSPTDSRIVPYSKAFCQSLTLSADEGVDSYNVSLYRLRSPPTLTGNESFSFSQYQDFSRNNYNYYYYYINNGSNFTVSACSQDGEQVTFYFIKGTQNFQKWSDSPRKAYAKDSFRVTDVCGSGKNITHAYNITSADFYYMVFDAKTYFYTGFTVNMKFYRTIYEFKNDSVIDSCYIKTGHSSQSCSVGIPFSGSTAFLTVEPLVSSQPIDWTKGVSLSTTCDPRIWLYVIVAVSILLTSIAILVSVALCIFVCIRMSKNKYTLVSEDPAPLTTHAPTKSTPSPINPDYGTNSYEAPLTQ